MSLPLTEILGLVGKLDDTPGDDSPRDRFRRYLHEKVATIAQTRDFIEECLRNSGDQYSRALQDLINHLGHFLGFETICGRYQGVQGEIGYDGHWISPSKFHIVVEVKTSEVYPIKAATLVGYVDELISAQQIPSWDDALGLYVIGRPDPDIQQLHNAILAERRTHQLRIVSVESLVSLAEIMSEYDVTHTDVLSVLRPSGPQIDPLVRLMERLAAASKINPSQHSQSTNHEEPAVVVSNNRDEPDEQHVSYWLTPVQSDEEQTAEEVIRTLVGQANIYAFAERTPGRKHVKPGDWICFYATGTGVVAHARIASYPENKPHPTVRQQDKYNWTFRLRDPHLYLAEPVVIDAEVRGQLVAFDGRDPNTSYWAWFVQATRRLEAHDFSILTRQSVD